MSFQEVLNGKWTCKALKIEDLASCGGGRLRTCLSVTFWNISPSVVKFQQSYMLIIIEGSESEWSNQRQEDSFSYKKFLPGKIITYMEMIGLLPRCNTMKCQLQSMSGTLLGTCCKMLATITINKCQVRYLEMLGTYPRADIHETVRYWNVIIHDM